jgi:predicted DNA-binding transcriptional regulator AlpA
LTCQGELDIVSGMEIPEQYEVLGPDELARQLGYTPSTVYTHLSRNRFDKIPAPSRRLAMGPVWYVGDVEEWRTIRSKD